MSSLENTDKKYFELYKEGIVKKYKLLVVASLLFFQMCQAVDVHYLDSNDDLGALQEIGKDAGFVMFYLNDPYSGLLDFEHTGNDEYNQHFDGYYSMNIGIYFSNEYELETFDIIMKDIETNNSIKEDYVYCENKIQIERYSSVNEIIRLRKKYNKIDFDILYKKEKMKNVKRVLITINYVFNQRGKLIQGEFKKELHRKSRFKLG